MALRIAHKVLVRGRPNDLLLGRCDANHANGCDVTRIHFAHAFWGADSGYVQSMSRALFYQSRDLW